MSTLRESRDPGDAAGSARVMEAVDRKRAGGILPDDEITAVVSDYVAGRIPHYQMAAWLATIACRGLSGRELAALTRAYIQDRTVDLSSIGRPVVDKHSTGGVGDTTTLIVVPIVAACGVPVVKMTGRGLGFAGGTLDKLESIPGLRVHLSADELVPMVRAVGMIITGQSSDLAPGDGATYALRDVTGTVESIPLIAASIISKKVAVRASGLVLDVKTGAGALTPDRASAVELTDTMLSLAASFGLTARAVLSDMTQPLGPAVGNALEVKQALSVLRGERTRGLWELCATLCRLMLQSADPGLSDDAADAAVNRVIDDGSAHDRFLRWASAQGADASALADPARLPATGERAPILAARSGVVTRIEPRAVGQAAVLVGAGRLTHDAPLNHAAGVVSHRRVGDRVDRGDLLAELHYDGGDPARARSLIEGAFVIGDAPSALPPTVHQIF